ncbi:hypothetical protein GIB67_007166 [Kingdonia uniflora]|uniref:Uncharacterized protein n=1 Tax=Kingdonia uniflora TaxID=39325 RepID=A0A7J7MLE8_9MAGN|nr:hypothetical protein GIB67_007166 [Kingdonia uniflora]
MWKLFLQICVYSLLSRLYYKLKVWERLVISEKKVHQLEARVQEEQQIFWKYQKRSNI